MNNILHRSIFLLLFCGCQISAFSQQTSLATFHRYNWQFVNPAAVDRLQMFGQKRTIITAGSRQQWVGLEGAPALYSLSFEHMPYDGRQSTNPIKWGIHAFKDETGEIATTSFSFNFNYFLRFKGRMYRQRRLYFGISPSVLNYRVKVDDINFKDNGEPLTDIVTDQSYLDFSIGMFYQQTSSGVDGNLSGFYVGLSMPQTLALNIRNYDNQGVFGTERVRHLYAVGGCFLPILDDRVIFEPSSWVRYVPGYTYETTVNNLPISMDVSLRSHFMLKNSSLFWVGAGYGTNGNLKSEVGISLQTGELSRGASSRVFSEGTIRMGFGWELPLANQGINLGQTLDVTFSYAWD